MKIKTLIIYTTLTIIVTSPILTYAADTIFDQRFSRWKKQAENGNKRAQYKLGNAYLTGSEVRVNIKKAVFWFNKSAKKGYYKAAHKLGMIYYFNKDGSRSYRKAFSWFKKAANKRHAEAQYYLGKMYFDGKGTKKNYTQALFWLKRAEGLDFLPATREIRKVQDVIKRKGTPTVAATQKTRSTKTPSSNRPTPKPTSNDRKQLKGFINTRKILFSGYWKLKQKPAEHMPSSVTNCKVSDREAVCLSERLKTNTDAAQVSYQVESKFSGFKPAGIFTVIYRKNYLFVLPNDPDDPTPDDDIPAMGWQKTISKLVCKIINKNTIDCRGTNLRLERYTK